MTSRARGDNRNDRLSADSSEPRSSLSLTGLPTTAEPERTTAVGSVAGLRTLRRTLSHWLLDIGIDDDEFAADVQLATVEVVTNALVHGMAESVSISLDLDHRDLIVTTEHGATAEADPFPATLPPTTSLSGRGLYIVDQVARERVVSYADGLCITRLQIPVPTRLLPNLQLVATGT